MTQNNVGIYASQISGHLYGGPYGAYDSLATVTLSSTATSITFAGIPSGYKHLQIRGIAKESGTGTGGPNMVLYCNSDTTYTNYYGHYLNGNGSSAAAGGVQASGYNAYIGNTTTSNGSYTNMFSGIILDVLDYSSTTKNKTIRAISGHDNNGSGEIVFNSAAWFSTSAITSLTISIAGGTSYVANSQFALYGIK